MKLLGVPLQRPTIRDLATTVAISAGGLLVITVVCLVAGLPFERYTAGIVFGFMLWAGLLSDLGFRANSGWRRVLLVALGALAIAIGGTLLRYSR
jgi:hypothetical protein